MSRRPEKPPLQPFKPGQTLKPGVTDEQQRLIGRVIISWSWLEAAMQDLLWSLLGVPIEDGRIITQRTDAARKMQWIRSFATRHLDDGEKAEFAAVLDDIERVQADRNFICHGTWGTLMPENVSIAASVREKSDRPDKVVSETFPTHRMECIIRQIDAAKDRLVAWRTKHETSRERPPPQPLRG